MLGQNQSLANWSAFPENEEDERRFQAAIETSFLRVVTVREDFRNFLTNYSTGHNLPDKFARLLPDEGRELRKYQHMSIECLQFSDTIVAYAPLLNTHGYMSLEPIIAFLLCSGWLLHLNLSKNTPIRGAIEVGIAGHFPDADLYGPVLAAVHRLESKVAVYPRIVLGKTILKCLSDVGSNPASTGSEHTNRLLAGLCQQLICQDEDGEWIIDYLGAFGTQ